MREKNFPFCYTSFVSYTYGCNFSNGKNRELWGKTHSSYSYRSYPVILADNFPCLPAPACFRQAARPDRERILLFQRGTYGSHCFYRVTYTWDN